MHISLLFDLFPTFNFGDNEFQNDAANICLQSGY